MYCGQLKLITLPIYLDMILWEGYRHIAGMKIRKTTNNTITACAHGLLLLLAIRSTRLITKYII